MSSCTPFINRTITEEVPCFREGNTQDWRGIQISVLVVIQFFSNDQHTASNATCSNLTFFRAHLPYLGDYVHFLSINYAHNSNSNNRCMKRCTRTVWKTMLMLYKKVKHMVGKYDAWCGAMVWPHCALVKSWEGLIYVVMHALHKSNHHWESSMLSRGKSQRLKGNPNFRPSLSFSFFPTINIPPQMQHAQIWHFFGLIYHI